MPDKSLSDTKAALAEEMANRRMKGETIASIAEAVDRTTTTVYKTLNAMKVEFPILGRKEIREIADARRRRLMEVLVELGDAATSHQLLVKMKGHYPTDDAKNGVFHSDLRFLEREKLIEKFYTASLIPLRSPSFVVYRNNGNVPSDIYPDKVCRIIVEMAHNVKGHHSYNSLRHRLAPYRKVITKEWRQAILDAMYPSK
jgi:hypothetical protein